MRLLVQKLVELEKSEGAYEHATRLHDRFFGKTDPNRQAADLPAIADSSSGAGSGGADDSGDGAVGAASDSSAGPDASQVGKDGEQAPPSAAADVEEPHDDLKDLPSISELRVSSKMGDGLRGMVQDVEWRLKEQVRFGLAAGIGIVRLLAAKEAMASIVHARRRRQAHDMLLQLAAEEKQQSMQQTEEKEKRKQAKAAAKRAKAEARIQRQKVAKAAKKEQEKRAEEARRDAEAKRA